MRHRDLRTDPLRLLIVDDDPLFGEALSIFLDRDDRLEVLAVAEDLTAAVAQAQEFAVDVALVDVRLGPGEDGFGVIAALHAHDPSIVALMMSGMDASDYARDAVRAGACDVVQKSDLAADGRDRVVSAFISAGA